MGGRFGKYGDMKRKEKIRKSNMLKAIIRKEKISHRLSRKKKQKLQ